MIRVSHPSFSYTQKPFIQEMNFSVGSGEIIGFLGPSGAGKSTLQKILLGMLPGYQGSAIVNGIECNHHGSDFYESIGVDFEFSTLYEKQSAKENLQFFSSLYRRQTRWKFWRFCLPLCICSGSLLSPYLGWDFSDPENAVFGAAFHVFEWLYVRIAPIILIGGIVGVFLTQEKG